MAEVIRCGTCQSDRLQVLKVYTNDSISERVVICEFGHETTIRRKLEGRVWQDGHWNTIEAESH